MTLAEMFESYRGAMLELGRLCRQVVQHYSTLHAHTSSWYVFVQCASSFLYIGGAYARGKLCLYMQEISVLGGCLRTLCGTSTNICQILPISQGLQINPQNHVFTQPQTHTNTYKHTDTHTDTHRHTQTHTNTHKHTQTHTNTHIHTQGGTHNKQKQAENTALNP